MVLVDVAANLPLGIDLDRHAEHQAFRKQPIVSGALGVRFIKITLVTFGDEHTQAGTGSLNDGVGAVGGRVTDHRRPLQGFGQGQLEPLCGRF